MDLNTIGKFIAALRKEQGLSQQELGEKLGVTNKTVSRWETGTYLPPAEVLLTMSGLFSVSVNELLSGRRLTDGEYRQAAEENLSRAVDASAFTARERMEFFKKKWLREHIAVMVLLGVVILAVFIAGFALRDLLVGSDAILLLVLAHGWRHNAMMTYAERKAFR